MFCWLRHGKTNFKESQMLSSESSPVAWPHAQRGDRPHFPNTRVGEVIFCSSVIPKPHSWKPGFIYHCFARLLQPAITCLKTAFAAKIPRARIFKPLLRDLPQFCPRRVNLLEKETYSSSAPFPHSLILEETK